MIRTNKVMYRTDGGRDLISFEGAKANVHVFSASASELEELASACLAAAEELKAIEHDNANHELLAKE